MQKTMIYLEAADHDTLRQYAKAKGETLSHLIRNAIRYYVEHVVQQTSWRTDPLWQLGGSAASKHTNRDAREHDALLYNADTA